MATILRRHRHLSLIAVMLNLLHPTDPSWVEAAQADLNALLLDHAHCEIKAAQSALALIGRFGADVPAIVEPLADLVREETAHFKEVHDRLKARGLTMIKPEKDTYVAGLMKAARSDETREPILLDKLLVSALIEARSCERFKLLSEGLNDHALSEFYHALMVAEARHYRLFFDLASVSFSSHVAKARLKILAEREAEVAHHLPLGPTVHG